MKGIDGLRALGGIVLASAFLILVPGCVSRTCPACSTTLQRSQYQSFALQDPAELQSVLLQVFSTRRATPSALLLSGGGANGAWGAGALKGWSESGDRPAAFDIVTGISTGSLISSFAFIGREADAILERAYTTVSNEDIYRKRFFLTAVFFSSSLKTTEPLEEMLRQYVTKEIIDRVGAIYQRERRLLLVGTVDMDSGAFVMWDMTKLAASTEPDKYDMYRRVLLAATAIPVVFPPVMIDGAMHVDGGIREQVFGAIFSTAVKQAYGKFLGTLTPTERPSPELTRKPAAYFVVNGQLLVNRECAKPRILPMALRSVSVLLAEGMIGNLYKSKTIMADWDFRMSRIPDDYQLESGSEDFNQPKMRRLFNAGYEWGKGHQWEDRVPPPAVSPLPCSG